MENESDAIMQKKLDAIKDAIQHGFPNGEIYYRGSGSRIYKFELVSGGLSPCRIDFAWEYL